ncbi:universal stress protein [Winogradskyella undariae]|uniref:universal stress protein n=1 Tax=Winogradskyella TaxID=286104 RepID=UPI00156B8BEE|nr:MULTISPECIES: universal stress protein [Winogradskyella]NRR92078.1 universal stress protein [Winogradskyella undariae]QXP80317.1 universal stress protein [Winogradskyella sp. HaHa_3_26]
MNILLPTDFSQNSWNAILYAIDFYKSVKCNFYILNVCITDSFIGGDSNTTPTAEQINDLYTQPSKQRLASLLKRIHEVDKANDNHHFYTLTEYGFFLESIRKHVIEKKINTLVMGTKGASGLKKYIVGSNTGDVITKVKCTTLVVPECAKYNEIKEVAFPSDFNLAYDLKTLEPLTNVLKASKANLSIVHIQRREAKLNAEQLTNLDIISTYFEEYKPSFQNLECKKVEDAIQSFVEQKSIDMIAMVAKNLNYFQSILFHSRVEKISYHTDIPFLVIHE